MIKNQNKKITNFNYNHLNLPTQVTIGGQNIDYIYDTSGAKLRKTVNGTTTDYAGNYIYENNNLQFFNHPEGYVTPNGSSFTYVYQYKDHLGNVRLSYADSDGNGEISASAEIIEENNYYPFGLKHRGYNNVVNGAEHPYKYQGKKHEGELGLNTYDFGARNYMPDLGCWTTIDPLAEDFVNYTPYNSMMNNPIMFIDPDGRAAMAPIYDTDGNLLGTDDQGLQGKAIVMDKEDFKQGMSHDEASAKNKGAEGLNGKEAESKLVDSYNGLKDRPDYDGKVTLSEANEWFRNGEGSPLYVDSSKIDLAPVETSDFGGKDSMYYNFFTDGQGDYTTGRVYGTIKLSLMNEDGTVKLGGNNGYLDTYDFDIKENKNNNFKTGLRNFGTKIGRALAGKGTAYKIYTYGAGTVEKSKKNKQL